MNLPREAIKQSPEYDRDEPVTRAYEIELCRFYNREGYWEKSCGDDSLTTDSIG